MADQWHRKNRLLRKIGLEKLNEKGYINLDTVNIEEDFGFDVKHHRLKAATFRREYVKSIAFRPTGDLMPKSGLDKIHCLFDKEVWLCDEVVQNYNLFKPSFQLATLLLEEESMASWLIGMMDVTSHKRIVDEQAETRYDSKLYYFQPKLNPSQKEREELWANLWNLAWSIRFNTTDIDDTDEDDLNPLHGITKPQSWKSKISTDGCGSVITVARRYIMILARKQRASSEAIFWVPGTDEESARLRVQFMFATVLVHELIHALWFAKVGPHKMEPFFLDTREAELGQQWEKEFYGADIQPSAHELGAPYGLNMQRWPGVSHPVDLCDCDAPVLMSAKKWGREPERTTVYAVEMAWVQGFFTHDYWEHVDRYGLSHSRPARRLGVRTHKHLKLWADEDPSSPTLVFPPRSPASEEDIEDPETMIIDI